MAAPARPVGAGAGAGIAAPTANRLIVGGAISGALGAVAASGVLLLLGEPAITDAIALEAAHAPAGEVHDELFSRGVQVVGGTLGMLLVGIMVGLAFGVVFTATRHRLPGTTDWVRARWLALAGFLTIVLAPALKYPANPPAVGDPDTIGARTTGYVALIGIALAATVLAVRLAPAVRARVPASLAGPATALSALLIVGVAFVVLPAAAPAPDNFPADLLWQFRLASLGGQVALWSALAVAFGAVVNRTRTA